MGGFGSGPSGGRPTVQDALSLDINQLRHDRFIRPGQGWGGALKWSDPYTGRNSSSVGYESHLGTEQGRLRLVYTRTGSDGTKQNADYWIDLATTAQPFGGRRWWFVCPQTKKLVSKLYLAPGALIFASRGAYRLAYHSQRETPRDRSLSRAFKARRRLGDHEGIVAAPFGAYVTHQLPDRALMILVGIVNMLLTRELRHWLTLVLRV
jgi:hypothetical protein